MELSNKLRKLLIGMSGYWIYRRKHLPIGADFLEDLKKLNLPLKVIFDVGANYGQTAKFYSENFSDAEIYSFEPIKASFKKLVHNIQDLRNVQAFQHAFGQEETDVEIPLFEEAQSQLNSLKKHNNTTNPNADKETISVKTIDSFIQTHNIRNIDLLKIDTEGYEIEVLKGAVKTIKCGQIKFILCEVALSTTNDRNTPICEVIEFLLAEGYTLLGLYDTNINYLKEGLTYSNALFVKV